MIELRQSPAYAKYMEAIGWVVEQSDKGVFAYVKRLPLLPVGVMKVQRVNFENLDFDWLREISRKHRVVTSYIELDLGHSEYSFESGLDDEMLKRVQHDMGKNGYRPTKSGMLPTKTRIVDLRLSDDELLKQMKPKTRYNIGLADRKGLQTQIVTGTMLFKDNDLFFRCFETLKNNAKRVGWMGMNEKWFTKQMKAFGDEVYCVMASDNDELLAVLVILVADEVAYYEHNGSTEVGRKLMAPTWCVWQGMQEAKRRGLKRFDFDGVYDERFPLKRWKGFSRFKQGFGGVELEYLPAYVKWLPYH